MNSDNYILKRDTTALILFFTLAFVSCKNMDKRFTNDGKKTETGMADGSYQLKLNPSNGSQYYYTISNQTEMNREVEDKEYKSSNNITVGLLYSISRDSTSNLGLQLTYNKFNLKGEADGDVIEIDAATAGASSNVAERIFSVFKNARLSSVINPMGSVISIVGLDSLSGNIVKIANDGGTDAEELKMLTETLGKLVNEKYFRQMLEQSFKIFPAKPVAVGDSWQLPSTLQSDLELPVSSAYTLESVEDSIATIRSFSKMDMEEQPLKIQGVNVTATLEGKQEGSIKMNIFTGMVLEGNTQFSLKGTINLLGKEVPITVRNKTVVTGRRL